jgi:hypothetical protein
MRRPPPILFDLAICLGACVLLSAGKIDGGHLVTIIGMVLAARAGASGGKRAGFYEALYGRNDDDGPPSDGSEANSTTTKRMPSKRPPPTSGALAVAQLVKVPFDHRNRGPLITITMVCLITFLIFAGVAWH